MLKELEDYKWFPAILRRWQMDFIGSLAVWTKLYTPLAPVLQHLITETGSTKIQDVCSGSGLPALYIQKRQIKKILLFLSDKYPNTTVKNIGATYIDVVTDVTELLPDKNTSYTMYNAFHHFDSATQKGIVNRMVAAKAPFLIAEILQPGILNVIKIFCSGTIVQLLTAPFVKPFSLVRLFFTYIVPINVFTVTYDGIVSVLKSKTAKEFSKLLQSTSSTNYAVTVHKLNAKVATIVYIKGQPISV